MLSIHRKRNILTKLAQASGADKAQRALDVIKKTTKGVNFGMPKAALPPKAKSTLNTIKGAVKGVNFGMPKPSKMNNASANKAY